MRLLRQEAEKRIEKIVAEVWRKEENLKCLLNLKQKFYLQYLGAIYF